MKELKIILVVLLIALPIFGVYRYVEVMSPVWTMTAAQQAAIDLEAARQNARVDTHAHQERTQLITGALSGFGNAALLILVAVGGVYAWTIYDKRQESWARPVDGQYAL